MNILLMLLASFSAFAQNKNCTSCGVVESGTLFCESKSSTPRYAIKHVKQPSFFRQQTAKFCKSPVQTKNGTLVTVCDTRQIRFFSPNGTLMKTIPVPKGKNSTLGDTPEITAVPGSAPEKFAVTSPGDGIFMTFDITGKVLSTKAHYDADSEAPIILSKPCATKNGGIFYYDDQGNGYLQNQGEKDPVKFNVSTSSMYDPVPYETSGGESKILVTDDHGDLSIIGADHSIKKIRIGDKNLDTPVVAPDGKIWIGDVSGKMNVVDVTTGEVRTYAIGKDLKKAPTVKRMSRPVFLKNGKVVIGDGDRIFLFDSTKPENTISAYDANLNNNYYHQTGGDLIGNPRSDIPMGTIQLANGEELVWVSENGGYHFINDKGAVVAIVDYNEQFNFKGDDSGYATAESFSAPVPLKDGSFAIGLFNGMDVFRIENNGAGKPLVSGTWVHCNGK